MDDAEWELCCASHALREEDCPPEAAVGELRVQLHLTPHQADALLDLAHDLTAKLPVTLVALRGGILDLTRAQLIASRCAPLTTVQGGSHACIQAW